MQSHAIRALVLLEKTRAPLLAIPEEREAVLRALVGRDLDLFEREIRDVAALLSRRHPRAAIAIRDRSHGREALALHFGPEEIVLVGAAVDDEAAPVRAPEFRARETEALRVAFGAGVPVVIEQHESIEAF